jgi:hypothetical protein
MYEFNPERMILDRNVVMKLKAVTSYDNYTVSFKTLSVNWYNNKLFPIPNKINEFVNLRNVPPPVSTSSG